MTWRKYALLLSLALAGCAAPPSGPDQLAPARASVQALLQDAQAQRLAPQDVSRADDSLQRAERLSGYWGNADQVQHYAYLSLRYAEIARAHAQAAAATEQLGQLEQARQRLQLAQQAQALAGAQQQGQALERELMALATAGEGRGTVLTLGDALFDSGAAELQPSATATLLKLGHYLQLNPQRRIRLEGYSDDTGSPDDNQTLSRQRAQAVAALLFSLGVAPERVEVLGYGAAYPVAVNATARGRALNRRVEVVISARNGVLGPLRAD